MDNLLVQHYGEIENGQLYIFDRQGFKERIRKIQPCRITIELRIREGSFSHQMRKYYFGSLLREVQVAYWNAGYEYDLDTLDQMMRMNALYREVFDEEEQRYRKEPHSLKDSDTEVTVRMFVYFIEWIIRHLAVDLDYSASYPNEILRAADMTEKQLDNLISKKW